MAGIVVVVRRCVVVFGRRGESFLTRLWSRCQLGLLAFARDGRALLTLLGRLLLRTVETAARGIGVDHAIVMFGVLVEVFGGDTVAGRRRVAGQLQIFLKDLVGIPTDTDVGSIAVESLGPRRDVRLVAAIIIIIIVRASSPRPFVI